MPLPRVLSRVLTPEVARSTVEVDASAADIFELLATPAEHAVLDGSGTVRGTQPGTPVRLSPGARFGMQMKIGAPYKILNRVVEFEEGRRIAWQHFGRHTWRYLLEPIGERRTRVTEEFDPTTGAAPWVLALIGASRRNKPGIDATLRNLQEWARKRH